MIAANSGLFSRGMEGGTNDFKDGTKQYKRSSTHLAKKSAKKSNWGG